ncbi:MAG: SPOR domain-containing protein [Pseudomonadota bacterium]
MGGDATRATPFGGSVQLIERDIEAPEVFRAQDQALWDGRPSLGGVWVAAPDVRDPERVIIRNEENGKFVIGALFNRERANPGPTLQLSSDAAAALGVIAGAPTSVDVVALRREEVPDPTAAPATSAPVALDDATTEPLAEEIVQAEPLETTDLIETANAALDAPVDAASEVALEATDPADGIDLVTEAGAELADAAIDAPAAAPQGNFFQRLFRRNRGEAAVTDMPEDPTGLNAPLDQGIDDTPLATSAATPVIESTSLDAPDTRVASAAPASTASETLERAYVQIGIFSVEENARETAASLSDAGVLATVLEQESRGKKFWRVIVGPATTASDRAAILRTAQDLGFADAYAVRG